MSEQYREVATIGEISKDENNVLLFSVKEFGGHRYGDIRRYFRNYRGKMIPTQTGITIPKKSIDDAITYMKAIRDCLNGEEAF